MDGSGTPVDVYARGPDVGDGARAADSCGQGFTDVHDCARRAGCVDGDGSAFERGGIIGRRSPDDDVLLIGSTRNRHRRHAGDDDIEPVGIDAGGIDAHDSRHRQLIQCGNGQPKFDPLNAAEIGVRRDA